MANTAGFGIYAPRAQVEAAIDQPGVRRSRGGRSLAGPIVALLSGVGAGAAVRDLTGALVGLGIPEYGAKPRQRTAAGREECYVPYPTVLHHIHSVALQYKVDLKPAHCAMYLTSRRIQK